MSEYDTALILAAENGDAARVERLLKIGAEAADIETALERAIGRNQVKCVELLSPHFDLNDSNCYMFRLAVKKASLACARLLVPQNHPNLPKGYIYVEVIIRESTISLEEKMELLGLCTQVFDMTHSDSRALRAAVFLNCLASVDVLEPFSDVRQALRLSEVDRRANPEALQYLRAKMERKMLSKAVATGVGAGGIGVGRKM